MIQERHILQFMFRHITKNNQQAPPFQKKSQSGYSILSKMSTFQPKIARHGKK